MFFGLGAYATGIASAHGWGEPLSGLLIGVAVAAAMGAILGAIVLRTAKFTLLMLTLSSVFLAGEVANKATWLTGGVDGLVGISTWPVLGVFEFDLFGQTGFAYASAVFVLVWFGLRWLVHAPFGQSVMAIRDNPGRAAAIGMAVLPRLILVYAVSCGIAGLAGSLQAEINQFAGLKDISFELSATILVMLALGGAGRLYGAVVGPAAYLVAQDVLAKDNPVLWQLWLGVLIVAVVLFAPGGLLGIADRLATKVRAQGPAMTPALQLSNLTMRFGGLAVTNDVSLTLAPGARHALIGPNGAGKTTLVNLVTGRLRPLGGTVHLAGRDVTALPQHRRTRLGLVRNFQVTNLFASFSALENVALAVAEREGAGLSLRSRRGFASPIADEAEAIARRMGLGEVGTIPVRDLAYGQQRLVELAVAMALRPHVLLLDEPAAGLPAADHALILDALDDLPPEVAVLLIEHDMPLVFRFARDITVLAEGAVIAQGAPDAIRQDRRVRAAYLGTRS